MIYKWRNDTYISCHFLLPAWRVELARLWPTLFSRRSHFSCAGVVVKGQDTEWLQETSVVHLWPAMSRAPIWDISSVSRHNLIRSSLYLLNHCVHKADRWLSLRTLPAGKESNKVFFRPSAKENFVSSAFILSSYSCLAITSTFFRQHTVNPNSIMSFFFSCIIREDVCLSPG